MDFFVRQGGFARHIHADVEERFLAVSGVLKLSVGGKEVTLRSGESATAAPGVPHTLMACLSIA